MIIYILWFTLLMSLAGAGAMHSTIVNLKMAHNYKTNVQDTYHAEGAANAVAHWLWEGQDLDGDGQSDKLQVHGNETVTYVFDGYTVVMFRDPDDPNQAIVQVGNVELGVRNFPGSGTSCGVNGKCEPRIFTWREG